MSAGYPVIALTDDERERLQRTYVDLRSLATCAVPSVRASARAALAHIAQALNGEGIAYELYTQELPE